MDRECSWDVDDYLLSVDGWTGEVYKKLSVAGFQPLATVVATGLVGVLVDAGSKVYVWY